MCVGVTTSRTLTGIMLVYQQIKQQQKAHHVANHIA